MAANGFSRAALEACRVLRAPVRLIDRETLGGMYQYSFRPPDDRRTEVVFHVPHYLYSARVDVAARYGRYIAMKASHGGLA